MRIRVQPGQLAVDPACPANQRCPRQGTLGHRQSLTELGRAQAAVRDITNRCEDVGASPHDDAGPVGREFLFPQTTEGATT